MFFRKSISPAGDFLVLLIGYYDLSYKEIQEKLIRDGTARPNVFNKGEMVLSNLNNTFNSQD